MYQTLLIENKDSIAVLTINRPEKLNALSELMLTELKHFLKSLLLETDSKIRGLILTGAGTKAFVAGADIKEMSLMTADQGEVFGQLGQDVTTLFETLPIPVIACVNGFALGGGCEMAMACDFIFATTSAVFGQPEVSLGLIPGFGGCVRLMKHVGVAKAKELIYSGRMVKADEAFRLGLVNEVYDSQTEMLSAAEKCLRLILQKSPHAVALCKHIINTADGENTTDGLRIEKAGFRRAFESEEMREGTRAFLEKRKPQF